MRAYSQDLRERALGAYENGEGGYSALGRRFRVAASMLYRWVRHFRREGCRGPKVYRHGFLSVLDEDGGAVIRQLVAEQPDATLAEYAARFKARTGCAVSVSTVCRALHRFGLTLAFAPEMGAAFGEGDLNLPAADEVGQDCLRFGRC